jgi:hypothetical protein
MKYKQLSVMLIAALLVNLFLPSTVQAKVYSIKDVEINKVSMFNKV